ncbi:pentatricopeptide repeat-containing protein At1g11290, chloroplastic [Dioscorea cayenensis subsp. rotundata]|uniref:Pentatricopeptide repeat-containing protein At1g11290, chloroplastic n=1 Tax=Dioscorea cayennensis subsp. rotundata TaxID=55577 RepID=A0AB40C4A5_DIOCR|nr:pentatricopeptide repeat-containing protein At1g11290, chloroplastic [Dioscorea cayenensis subsp. rotundata]
MASALKAFTPSSGFTLSHSKKASAVSPEPLSFLELCSSSRELRQILPQIIKHELYYEPFVQAKLIALFSRFAALREASLVFDSVVAKTDELYHSILKGHAHHSSLDAALSFFISMKHARVRPVVYNLTYLLKSCGDNSDLQRGREIHSQLVTNGFSSNIFAMTAVVNMYAKCRQIDDARKMFDRMPERDLVAWNAIVAGYAQNGLAENAFEMVLRLQEDGKKPDSITLVSILPACAATGSLKIGCSIHGYALRACLESLVNVSTALIDMYSKCGALRAARLVFDRMRVRNVVSWNSMIDGYAQRGNAAEAMMLFRKMLVEGVQPTEVTAMAVLHACGELGNADDGKSVHELLSRIGLCFDYSVMNCLITMYCKCKRLDIGAEIFESLPEKTLVSWNAMISGYTQNGKAEDALRLFCRMCSSKNVQPDSFTLVSVIPALADVSMLRQAKWMHGHAIRLCLDQNIFVMTALVDMYSKCGGLSIARKLFDSMDERHVTTWNAMIDGYGSHGFGRDATELFEEMRKGLVKPNDVTFLCVLSACSHSGLVDEGKRYFESMKLDYGLEPAVDHYGTMVDLLGRAGRMNEAWKFIEKMPIKPSISVYGAMLGACKIHKNVELGEKAAQRLFELEPEEGGYHVLLSNIYATNSMWKEVARVRRMMEKKGLQKTPGCSFIELRNEVHTFYSGSTNHPQAEKIYARLDKLFDEIKAIGYVPDTESIHDVEDDVKVQLLNSHSEKLAIAFGLINTKAGATIQIRKNLRVCTDCHNATKFISRLTGREIIVRDMQRFHHFKDGVCSCRDYW